MPEENEKIPCSVKMSTGFLCSASDFSFFFKPCNFVPDCFCARSGSVSEFFFSFGIIESVVSCKVNLVDISLLLGNICKSFLRLYEVNFSNKWSNFTCKAHSQRVWNKGKRWKRFSRIQKTGCKSCDWQGKLNNTLFIL